MRFAAKAIITIIVGELAVLGFWNFQEHYPWRAAAVAFAVLGCVAFLTIKKGNR
jgi:hypothetical protein